MPGGMSHSLSSPHASEETSTQIVSPIVKSPNIHACMYATNSLNSHQISYLTHAQQTKIGKPPRIHNISLLGNHRKPPPHAHLNLKDESYNMNPKN